MYFMKELMGKEVRAVIMICSPARLGASQKTRMATPPTIIASPSTEKTPKNTSRKEQRIPSKNCNIAASITAIIIARFFANGKKKPPAKGRRSNISSHKIIERDFENIGKRNELSNRRLAVSSLPMRNGFYADLQKVGKLLLSQAAHGAQFPQGFTELHISKMYQNLRKTLDFLKI